MQDGLEEAGGGVGEVDDHAGAAAAEVGEPQAGVGAGVAFLLLEAAAFFVLGDLGGDDVEHAAAQDAQAAGVEVGGLGDQVGLGGLAGRGVDAGWQRVEGGGDDAGLGGVDVAGVHAGPQVGVGLEGGGELLLGRCGGGVDAGVVGGPGGHGAGAVVVGEVAGAGQDRQPQRVEAGRGVGQGEQDLTLGCGREVERVDPGGLVQRVLDPGRARHQGVRERDGGLAHGPRLGVTTDTFRTGVRTVEKRARRRSCGQKAVLRWVGRSSAGLSATWWWAQGTLAAHDRVRAVSRSR